MFMTARAHSRFGFCEVWQAFAIFLLSSSTSFGSLILFTADYLLQSPALKAVAFAGACRLREVSTIMI